MPYTTQYNNITTTRHPTVYLQVPLSSRPKSSSMTRVCVACTMILARLPIPKRLIRRHALLHLFGPKRLAKILQAVLIDFEQRRRFVAGTTRWAEGTPGREVVVVVVVVVDPLLDRS